MLFLKIFFLVLISDFSFADTIKLGEFAGEADITINDELKSGVDRFQCPVAANIKRQGDVFAYEYSSFCNRSNDIRLRARENQRHELILLSFNGDADHPSVGQVVGQKKGETYSFNFFWSRNINVTWTPIKQTYQCQSMIKKLEIKKYLNLRFEFISDEQILLSRRETVDQVPTAFFQRCYEQNQKIVFTRTTELEVLLRKEPRTSRHLYL